MAHESFEDDRGRADPQRGVRRGQGRPRGAPRRRRRLHGRDPGADRPGRLADDGADDARTGAVLLRHLLPASGSCCRCSTRSPTPGGRAVTRCWPAAPHIVGALREATPPPPTPLTTGTSRRCRRGAATPVRRRERRIRRAPRSSRPRCSWSSCSATTRRTGDPVPWRWRRRRAPPWPAAASTTSWPAGSHGMRSTSPGWCRTSRRCSTTTLCCCASTRTGGAPPDRPSPSGSPARPPTSCSATSGRRRAGSPVPSTPTRPVSRASRTPGAARSSTRSSATTTRSGPPTCCGVTDDGTFEDGLSTLQLPVDPADPVWWADVPARLLTARAGRPQPAPRRQGGHRLERAGPRRPGRPGRASRRPRYVEAATRAATFLVDTHLVDGRLRRVLAGWAWPATRSASPTTTATWPRACSPCTRRPPTPAGSAPRATSSTSRCAPSPPATVGSTTPPTTPNALFTRPRALGDNVEPVRDHVRSPAPCSRTAPSPARPATSTRRRRRSTPWRRGRGAEPAVRRAGRSPSPRPGRPDPSRSRSSDPARSRTPCWPRPARRRRPGLVPVAGEPDATGIPLLADRPLVDGRSAAYVCRGFVCDRPPPTPPSCVGSFRPRTSEPQERCARTLLAQRRRRRTGPSPRRPPRAACPPRRSSSPTRSTICPATGSKR